MLVTPRDPQSLIACARECHARGDNRRMVLRTCYGVIFPEELFVLLDLDDDAHTNEPPWCLAAADMLAGEPWLRTAERVYAIDRELVPLDDLDDNLVCYRLDELAAGRATLFALPREYELDDYSEAERIADSLLAYRHACAVAQLRGHEAQYASPANRGAGSIDQGDVDWARGVVEHVEAMQKELAARLARKRG